MIAETLAELVVPVGSVRPYGRNPRRGDVAAIKRSLEVNGQYRPIVVNRRTGEVLAGNHTLAAALELGWGEVAATFVDVDDQAAARIVLADNRTNDLAGYDDGALAELLGSLEQELGGTGWRPDDLSRLLARLGEGSDTEPNPPPAEPATRPGDLWLLGDHRLLCGDATDTMTVATLVGESAVAVMVTDPPYGVGVDHTWRDGLRQPIGAARTGRVVNDHTFDWEAAYELTDASVVYVWHSALHAGDAKAGLERAGFEVRQQIVWVKAIHALGRGAYQWKHEVCWYAVRKGHNANWKGDRTQTTVWEAASPIMAYGGGQDDQRTPHPTQKPIAVLEPAILNHTDWGDGVYDPFAGSGSTLIACENLGRRCFAMEIDPGYCDVVVDRWERHTGRERELVEGREVAVAV